MNEITMEQDPTDMEHQIRGILPAESHIAPVGLPARVRAHFCLAHMALYRLSKSFSIVPVVDRYIKSKEVCLLMVACQ